MSEYRNTTQTAAVSVFSPRISGVEWPKAGRKAAEEMRCMK
jgi:hypothetical protein